MAFVIFIFCSLLSLEAPDLGIHIKKPKFIIFKGLFLRKALGNLCKGVYQYINHLR